MLTVGASFYREIMKEQKSKKGVIYGARAVMEAMEAGLEIDKILIKAGLDSELRQDVSDAARSAGIPLQQVPVEKIERVVRGANHQGVLAYVSLVANVDLEELLLQVKESGETPLLLALDGVTDVRNLGAIARTAECMGAHALILPQQGSARINGDAVKVSAGALNHLPVCRVAHLQDAVHILQSYGVEIAACSEKAGQTVFEADLSGSVCLVFGSEEKGISQRIMKSADHLVKIPLTGKIESLNVSVAAGMVLMEVTRQRLA